MNDIQVTVMFEIWSQGESPYRLWKNLLASGIEADPPLDFILIKDSDEGPDAGFAAVVDRKIPRVPELCLERSGHRQVRRDSYQVYKDTFDFLYKNGRPALLNLTVHAHFGGRPMMSAMLRALLDYMKGFSEVWFARHDEIARWGLEQHPSQGSRL